MKTNNVFELVPPTLEEHLNECEARYQHLIERFDQVDQRFDRLEQVLLAIKQKLS